MNGIKLEFKIEEVNAILNALNMPSQTPATTAVYLINLIQDQATPQVAEMQAKEKEHESKTAS